MSNSASFDDFPLQVFEALQPWTGETGIALVHPGRGKKGLVIMDLSRALWLLDICKVG